MNSLLGRLRAAGFPADTTYHVYHVLDGFIFGFSLWEANHTYTDAETSAMAATFSATVTADAFPISSSTATNTSATARSTT